MEGEAADQEVDRRERKRNFDDIVDHSSQRTNLFDAEHASNRVRYGVEYQIESESSLCLVCDCVYTAEIEVVHERT